MSLHLTNDRFWGPTFIGGLVVVAGGIVGAIGLRKFSPAGFF